MGKVLRTIALVAALGAAIIATGGLALFGTTAGITLFGVSAGTLTLIAGAAGALSTLLTPSPKIPRSQLSRLNISLDPNTPRKAVMGTTAMPLDLRYHEASGTDQEYINYIIAVAAHKVASIDEIWFEEKQAWTASGGVTSTYSGYLTVQTRTEGTAGNAITVNSGAVWDSSCRLTGCAYVYLRIKRTGNSKKTESPLVQGLPSRITIIGEGAPLYDPRLDSTVPGGSGSHRADDQTTWGTYAGADDYDNPALQLLWFLLGWKINGKLSIGAGVPPERIDLESFITAANICDEDITLATGGTQKRYRTSGTASDEDNRMEAINTFLACMNGTLRDNGGKLTLALLKNDLADPVLEFTDGDFLGEFAWDQTGGGLSQGHNVIRGQYVDPSNNSLYQLAEYPEVSLPSPDGIERVMTFDLPFVEDGRRAQRLTKQVLQRHQFRGQLTAEFSAKALGCDVGDIVQISLEALGFNDKPFRVISKEIRPDGRVPLTLLEEDQLIYQWDRDDVAPVSARTPVVYDPLLNLMTQGDEEASTTANWSGIIDDNGNLPEDNADVTINNQITFSVPAPFDIQADSSSTTTTDLDLVTRSITTFRGGVAQTSGVTVGTATAVPAAAITVASVTVSSGVVTVKLSKADAQGVVIIPIIFGGNTYNQTIIVNRTVAAPISGGGGGSTSFIDSIWTNINSTTYTQVTDLDAQISSDASGDLSFQAESVYYGGVAVIKAQYSTDGSTWSDVSGSETTGTTPITTPGEEEPGYVSFSVTVTTLSASTNYYVRLVAKRTSGTTTLSWATPNFTVSQP